MKKRLCFFLVLCFCLFFCACGAKESPPGYYQYDNRRMVRYPDAQDDLYVMRADGSGIKKLEFPDY